MKNESGSIHEEEGIPHARRDKYKGYRHSINSIIIERQHNHLLLQPIFFIHMKSQGVAPLFTHYCVGVTTQNNNILTHN
jgi:hypothetical protein